MAHGRVVCLICGTTVDSCGCPEHQDIVAYQNCEQCHWKGIPVNPPTDTPSTTHHIHYYNDVFDTFSREHDSEEEAEDLAKDLHATVDRLNALIHAAARTHHIKCLINQDSPLVTMTLMPLS